MCDLCRKTFDTFQTQAVGPQCAKRFAVTTCLNCGKLHPFGEWILPASVPPLLLPASALPDRCSDRQHSDDPVSHDLAFKGTKNAPLS
jgi:hypothetical protein